MVTKRFTLLLLALLSVNANDDVSSDSSRPLEREARLISSGQYSNVASTEKQLKSDPSPHRITSNGVSSSKLNNRMSREVTSIAKQSNYFSNGRTNAENLYAVSDSLRENEPLLSRQRRSTYGVWQRLLPNADKNGAETDQNELIRNPSVQRMLYKLIKKKMVGLPNGKHSKRNRMESNGEKKADGDEDILYGRDGRTSPILHIPFGKRTSKSSNENHSPLKREMSAAYGNFGGPFGKRSSAEVLDTENPDSLSSRDRRLNKCLYIEKLGFRVDSCEELNKSKSNQEQFMSQ